MSKKMRILHCVEQYTPEQGGMQEVVRQLSENLVKRGHTVHVACRKSTSRDFKERNGVHVNEFDITGNWAGGMHGETDRYIKFLLEGNFDVITFFAAQQFATDLALDILPKIKAKKVFVPTGFSGLGNSHYQEYFNRMKNWMKHFDMNVFLSDDYRDVNFARDNGIIKRILIPNGAAREEFEICPDVNIREVFAIPANHKILFHLGSYTGWKGHKQAMELFLNSKLDHATLLMIGNHTAWFRKRSIFKYPLLLLKWMLAPLMSKRIILTEADRKTTVAAYFQSDLFLFPSMIECSPIVLFEASAAGLPWLATDVGNTKEISKWTGAGWIMPTIKNAQGFSLPDLRPATNMLKEIMEQENERRLHGEAGRQNWKAKFTWEKIAEDYEKLYLDLCNS